MKGERKRSGGWSLLACWIVASSIGSTAGLVGGQSLAQRASELLALNEDRVFGYALVICLGLGMGAVQAIVMGRHHAKPVRWVVATLIGYLLCLPIGAVGARVGWGGQGVWGSLLLFGLFGAAIGTAQWVVLRRHARQAGLWVLATAAGFLCFTWLNRDPPHSLAELILRGTLVGTLAAALPGILLVWCLGQPRASALQKNDLATLDLPHGRDGA